MFVARVSMTQPHAESLFLVFPEENQTSHLLQHIPLVTGNSRRSHIW